MDESPLVAVSHTIQLSVAPVFLLTAIGTILNVLNARLTRIVDRGRVLAERMAPLREDAQAAYRDELGVLARRRHCVNLAITFGVASALCVCLLIAVAFVGSLARGDYSNSVAVLFIAAMIAFVVTLCLFLREILLAVSFLAIKLP